MKKIALLLLLGGLTLIEFSCEKDENKTGDVMFWSDFNSSPIKVYINGDYKGRIYSYYGNAPDCGSSGCVNIVLNAGTYLYSAETEDNSANWSGSITCRSDDCTRMNLTDGKATPNF